MQLLPETAKGIALAPAARDFVVADLRDPEINVRYGTWYLDHLRDRYDGDVATRARRVPRRPGQRRRLAPRRERDRVPGDAAYVDEVERVRRVYAQAYGRDLGL